MQIQKYIKQEYPSKLNEMKFSLSIGELNKGFESEIIIRDEIMKIAAKWLSLNIKSKSINSDEGLMVVVEHILDECSNLELQEINLIFKMGVTGKFGIIYNDISIDTICGKEGWIETYYNDFRRLRKEPERKESDFRLTGKEMTLMQFHDSNPEYKKTFDLHAIFERAKIYKTTIEDAKQFYKIKELSLDDFKDDMEYFAKQYQNSEKTIKEIQYITEMFRKFIIDNIFKTK